MLVPTFNWIGNEDGHAEIIDQTKLPGRFEIVSIRDVHRMAEAIKRLEVRGAPAIGVAAAFGVVLGLQDGRVVDSPCLLSQFKMVKEYLAAARPTAVNLTWALSRLERKLEEARNADAATMRRLVFEEAKSMLEEDRRICSRLGDLGAELIKDGDRLLTHCNAGALATVGTGTALAVMYAAHVQGKHFEVFADETRPLLQGARLTAWELQRAGIPVTLICDSMAAWVMKTKKISTVFVGADRIAANGDTANKIGTYAVALAAKAHGVPFWVVAPESTFDLSLPEGAAIPIEERSGEEIVNGFGSRTAPEGVRVFAPAFDVTPADLITGIITEKGIISPVSTTRIHQILGR